MLAMSLASPVAVPLNVVAPGRGGRVFLEVERSRGGVVVALQKIVADAADVCACLERVVANDLGPVIGKVDIGFGAQPGQRHRIADQRGPKDVCREWRLVRCWWESVRAVGAIAGNAKGVRVVGSVVRLVRRVAQMGQADARFGKQGGREDVVVVEAGAVGRCDTGGFKSAASGAAQERAEERRLVGGRVLMAEAPAQVVLLA